MQSLASKLRPVVTRQAAARLSSRSVSVARRAPLLRAASAFAPTTHCASFSTGGKGPFARSRKKQQESAVESVECAELELNRLAVIGGGNMAEAIITGVVVSDPNPSMRTKYAKLNVETHTRNSSAVKEADVILVAVKPQVVDDVLRAVKASMDPDALVISVVAGQSIKQLQQHLGQDSTTVWAQSAEVTSAQHELTKQILGSFGVEVFVDDENALDMATALSGSGPAYFFLVAEAMIDTGVHMGFSRPVATKLVQQTMLGSALYMQSEDVHPVELRNNITSPGGTTAAGLYRAEKNGFRAVIADSIWAAYERCLELGSSEPVQRQRPRSRSPRRARPRSRSSSRGGRGSPPPKHSRSRSRSRADRNRGRSRSRSRDRRRDRSRGGDRRGRSRSAERGRRDPISLLVRNLSPDTTADELRRAFSRRAGDILDVYIPKEFSTNQPRGFAFIEFADARVGRDIKFEMDRTQLGGREIAVLFAKQHRKSPHEMRRILNLPAEGSVLNVFVAMKQAQALAQTPLQVALSLSDETQCQPWRQAIGFSTCFGVSFVA
ncbi:Pyrroline-5-carboxylate reductase, dimerization domain [Phytophthora cactorum]|nr:Pyrroline-5-carboxylate reductase, dimerization domain [Phytophthora cactorum]